MDNKLTKKYGLFTAMAMVVGIVIGSGVFFKAEKVLNATQGNLPLGILAWVVGGLVMVVSAYTFSIMARKYEKVNGVVDYAEATCGKKYGYFMGWFMAVIYYPSITSILAWVSARYVGGVFGFTDVAGPQVMMLAGLILVVSYAVNALSPIIAGKIQVSTSVIKLVPLLLMAVVGTIVGLANGITIENFTNIPPIASGSTVGNNFMMALVGTTFAYEGWIIATTINSELKDAKKTLPRALVLGTLIVMAVYVLYYVGLAGSVKNAELMGAGEQGVQLAFGAIFGKVGGTLLMVFVAISCLGTLNGMMLGCTRGMYSLATRDEGPMPEKFKQVDPNTNMPTSSGVLGALLVAIWLTYFYGANLTATWFGVFTFDSSEIPIISLYLLYIPMYVMMIVKHKEENVFNRFVMPILAILAAVIMITASIIGHGMSNLYYMIVFVVVMGIGYFFMNKKKD